MTSVRYSRFLRWISPERVVSRLEKLVLRARPMRRWHQSELAAAKLYLETKPPADFVDSDWALLVDYLVQRYLPPDDRRNEADWRRVRRALLKRMASAPQKRTRPSTILLRPLGRHSTHLIRR